jgi:hypothetical protein
MKHIPLSNSQEQAIISDEDYALVSRFRCHMGNDGNAYATINGRTIEMGKLICFPEIADGAVYTREADG